MPESATGSKYSNQFLFNEVTRTLPVEIELLQPLRFRIALDGGVFDFLLLKVALPEHKHQALVRWRENFQCHYGIRVLIDRANALSGIDRQLRRWSRNAVLLTDQHLPIVRRYIKKMFGNPPSPPVTTLPSSAVQDLRHLPFLAIDPPAVQGREDLVCAFPVEGSEDFRLLVAFIDITNFIAPGSYFDKYAQRIGLSLYGTHNSINTLGDEIANTCASFLTDETRQAWIVNMLVNPCGQITERSLGRALVKSAAHIDPARVNSIITTQKSFSAELTHLATVAQRLHHRRLTRPQFIMVQGEGTGDLIVSESMLNAKHCLASEFIDAGVPAVFKTHSPPTPERKLELSQRLNQLEILCLAGDLDDPLRLSGLLQNLQLRDHIPEARQLLKEILDVYLIRSRFDTVNRGHFGIGVDAYLEIKPRNGGLVNQFQLAALFDPARLKLAPAELQRRALRLNRQAQSRGMVEFKLRFLERLTEHLTQVGYGFSAVVREVNHHHALIDVRGFKKWGILSCVGKQCLPSLKRGKQVRVVLRGFNIHRMRFYFEPLPRAPKRKRNARS